MFRTTSPSLHSSRHTLQGHPNQPEEDFYAQDFLTLKSLYDGRISDEALDEFASSGKEIAFEFNNPHHHLYEQVNFYIIPPSEARALSSQKTEGALSSRHRLDDEYDYPLGIEDLDLEFEEDEAHSQDLSEDELLFDDPDIWVDPIEFQNDLDARYFDASDLYDRRDIDDLVEVPEDLMPNPIVHGVDGEEQNPSPRARDTFGDSISGRRRATSSEPEAPSSRLEMQRGPSKSRRSPFANLFVGPRIRVRSN